MNKQTVQQIAKKALTGFGFLNMGVSIGGLILFILNVKDFQGFQWKQHLGISGIVLMSIGVALYFMFRTVEMDSESIS